MSGFGDIKLKIPSILAIYIHERFKFHAKLS